MIWKFRFSKNHHKFKLMICSKNLFKMLFKKPKNWKYVDRIENSNWRIEMHKCFPCFFVNPIYDCCVRICFSALFYSIYDLSGFCVISCNTCMLYIVYKLCFCCCRCFLHQITMNWCFSKFFISWFKYITHVWICMCDL